MKRFRLKYLILVISLGVSNSFADDYKINTLSSQVTLVQDVVEVDISELTPGRRLEVKGTGGPVWIYRRTQEELDFISKNYTGSTDKNLQAIVSRIKRSATSTSGYLRARLQLVDQPRLEKSPYRSEDNEYFVFQPTGRYGCLLTEQLPSHVKKTTGIWLYDPCFSDVYDLSGRFVDQNTAVYSMDTGELIFSNHEVFPRTEIPPHRYTGDGTLVIGVADISTTPEISFSEEELYSDLTPTEVLLKATAFNDIARARIAIGEGADVISSGGAIPNPKVSLALRRAVFYSSMEMVELILSLGAVPHEIEIDAAKRLKRQDVLELLEAVSDQ